MELMAEQLTEYVPTFEELESYPFIYTNRVINKRTGREKQESGWIDTLSANQLVMEPDEALEVLRFIQRPNLLINEGYSEPKPPVYQIGYTDDAVGQYLRKVRIVPQLKPAGQRKMSQTVAMGQQLVRSPWLLPQGSDRDGLLSAASATWDYIVQANQLLAVSEASKQSRIPFGDAIQEANTGLMHAASKFNFDKGFAFSTYATWWIRQHISVAYPPKYDPDHIPRRVRASMKHIEANLEALNGEQRKEELIKLAAALKLEPKELEFRRTLIDRAKKHISLDAPVSTGSDKTNGEVFGDTKGEQTFPEEVEQRFVVSALFAAIERLPEPQKTIFKQYGIPKMSGEKGISMKTLVKEYGKDKNWVGYYAKMSRLMLMHPSMGLTSFASGKYEDLAKASCKGQDPRTFFTDSAELTYQAKARAKLCGECPVKALCEDFAREQSVDIGYWGGSTKAGMKGAS